MDNVSITTAIGTAVWENDTDEAERLLVTHPSYLRESSGFGTWLHAAAQAGHLPMVKLLVQLGLGVNDAASLGPEGPVRNAVNEQHVEIVRWLLENGAETNVRMDDGNTRNLALCQAAEHRNLEIVRLLVEHGANVNATWDYENPLRLAMISESHRENKEVTKYLLSKGAKEPYQIVGKNPENTLPRLIQHIVENEGRPSENSLSEDPPGDPNILIHFVPPAGKRKRLTMVTTGMCDRPMNVPFGEIFYQFAELYIKLPPDWPTGRMQLEDPKYRWPVDWLRRIAHYPHDNNDWLGGQFGVIANNDPPEPLGGGVPFTAFMLATSEDNFDSMAFWDNRYVHFYQLIPIYTEEYDLARAEGPEALIKLFQKHNISQTYDPKRVNVAKKGKK